MPNRAVIGTQWGDEGKGKIVDILSETADIVARCQGGANAGHTVMIGDRRFVLHLIPSGILHPHCSCLIGNGVVVDLDQLFREIEQLNSEGISTEGRLFVSGLAHLVLPYHKWTEQYNEEKRGVGKLETTLRGIGPAYVDKYGRFGIRIFDLFHEKRLRERLRVNFEMKSYILERFQAEEFADISRLCDSLLEYGKRLADMAVDSAALLHEACGQGSSMLFEGAQGTLLDIDFGTYPFVTSSSTTIGGTMTGLGIPPSYIDEVFGVAKAYTTRVGRGPFPTELVGEQGARVRERGCEYGATTGRPRRCGWLDLHLLKRAVMINGIDYLAMTKLDVLDEVSEIKVCIGYERKSRAGGTDMLAFYDLGAVEPIYKTLPGWMRSTLGITLFEDLPEAAREYIEFVEAFTGSPVALVSTGPAREETILRRTLVAKNSGVTV